jgi:hypothetical protein
VCRHEPPRSGGGGGLFAVALIGALVMLTPHGKALRGHVPPAGRQALAQVIGGLPLPGNDAPERPSIGAPSRPGERNLRPGKANRTARADIPRRYLALYQRTDRRSGIPWQVLAGIGKIESDHGRSRVPGVRSGVNAFGCCAGPMQFNLRNGPPSTWDTYGHGSPYRPEDAIPAAGRLLRASGAPGDLRGALYAYNHSTIYVDGVLNQARRYGWKG